MPRITVAINVLGMSGRPWRKEGVFEEPEPAIAFLESWWDNLSLPECWTLEIDGLTYDTPPYTKAEAERHIRYCFALHRAFYELQEQPDRDLS